MQVDTATYEIKGPDGSMTLTEEGMRLLLSCTMRELNKRRQGWGLTKAELSLAQCLGYFRELHKKRVI